MTVIEMSTRREYVEVIRCDRCKLAHPADLHEPATDQSVGGEQREEAPA